MNGSCFFWNVVGVIYARKAKHNIDWLLAVLNLYDNENMKITKNINIATTAITKLQKNRSAKHQFFF